ncbi:uncharacterized protein LOC135690903, partial [Rhopilema esculentum]|uniref:uncharacterized protein LOC135690903 n=1 Tax=Rhopilema esculentum TaxID=499914 RepID=UPI0031D5460B
MKQRRVSNMGDIVRIYVIASALFMCAFSFTPFGKEKRSVRPGHSHYIHETVSSLQTIRIQHAESGRCLEPVSKILKANGCDVSNSNQLFQMTPTGIHQGKLKHLGTNLCLSLSSSSDQLILSSCTTNNAVNVWKCHFPYVEQGKTWLERDWAGMRTVQGTKCVSVTSDGQVKSKDCTAYGKNVEEKIFVHGKKLMGVCATAGYLGPRTNDSNYYYFQHQKFSLNWQMKYIEVYMVYNNGVYNAFKSEYGTEAEAMKRIRQHALESISIVDKMYLKAKIRVLLKGFEVWSQGDLANTGNTKTSWEVHGNFREYSRKLRLEKGLKYDVAIHVFDKNLYGAAGTATSHYCRQSNWGEVFTMATLGGRDRIIPRSLANILTHELAHHLRSGHNFDPEYTCPTYHLFGGRCTLGGNDWPKAFSMGELNMIRVDGFSCLDNKPSQSSLLGCGNGVIESGEECDCGQSEDCLKNNPCCDGSICKLRRNNGAECSTERCCSNCKFDRTRNGCSPTPIVLSGSDFGEIGESSENVNILKSWNIRVSQGSKVTLIMNLMKFEFDEGCPNDYIEVRDGGLSSSPLIGRYCRSPPSMHVTSSTNSLYVTYKSDASFASHFKLFYTASDGPAVENKDVVIKSKKDGKCFEADYSKANVIMNTGCKDLFTYTKQSTLQHQGTGLCLEPYDWYGSYNKWHKILLKGDCSSHASVFISTSQDSFVHAASGYCLYNSNGNLHIMTCDGTSSTKFSIIKDSGPTTKPPIQGSFRIQHHSKKCFNYDSANQRIQLSSVCDDLYYLSTTKSLVHYATGKCVRPLSNGDNSYIALSANCDDNTKFELTSFGSLRQIKTGSCVHPLNGALYPKEGQPVVIYRGCDVDRLKFSFVAPPVR